MRLSLAMNLEAVAGSSKMLPAGKTTKKKQREKGIESTLGMATSAGGHSFEIECSMWSERERGSCDGKVVSEKWVFYTTPHFFRLGENGKEVTCEVNCLTSFLGLDRVTGVGIGLHRAPQWCDSGL